MPATLKNILSDFTALIFPEFCYACDGPLARGEALICTHCRLKLPYTQLHMSDSANYGLLEKRFYGKVPVKHALAYLYFNKSGRVQRLLHALKYRGVQAVGETLGTWYGRELADAGYKQAFEVVLPVPLHPRKLRQRGYNQATAFGQGLAAALQLPWADKVLQRTQYTSSQTRKSRHERWLNVEQVFRVTDKAAIKDKKILLVDDVITTGATLEACAITLLLAGCREVSICTIAAA
jgi:ComF family protein